MAIPNTAPNLSAYIIKQIEMIKHIGAQRIPEFISQCERWWITQDIMMISTFIIFVSIWRIFIYKLIKDYCLHSFDSPGHIILIIIGTSVMLMTALMCIVGAYDLIQSIIAPQLWILSNLRAMLQ